MPDEQTDRGMEGNELKVPGVKVSGVTVSGGERSGVKSARQ